MLSVFQCYSALKKHKTTRHFLKNKNMFNRTLKPVPHQRPFCTSSWWGGVHSQVGECRVGRWHQRGRPLAEDPPRALREVERLTRNPEKLANADAGVGRTP